MKDYYATLGVTPQAEDIVIKAAYRALAQRYHPDRFAGSANKANRKMAEINEAYGVLSDSVKRKAYDAEYQQAGGNEGDFEAGDAAADEGVQQVNQDWETALEYYPDLVTLESVLAKTSKSLSFTFRLYMITEKAVKNRKRVAEALHNAFLTNYFGEQRAVLDFAKTLIALGRKDAAKALNEAVRVLGDDLDPILVINKIKGRFGVFPENQSRPTPKNAAEVENSLISKAMLEEATVDDARRALTEHGGDFMILGTNIVASWNGLQRQFFSGRDFVKWFQQTIGPSIVAKTN